MTYCCYIHYMYAPCGICIGLLLTFASNGPQLRALRMFRELCVILTVGLQSFQLQKYRINKIVNLFQFYVQTLGRHQSQHFCCVWSGKISCQNPCISTIWYIVTKIVLTYCEKKLFYWLRKTFEILRLKAREFSKILRSLKQFIQTVKGQNNFW